MCEAILIQSAGQAIGSLVGPLVECGRGIFNCLRLKWGDVRNMSGNFALLEKEYGELCAKEKDLNKKLEENKRKMEKTSVCELWLSDVERKKVEFKKSKSVYQTTHSRFLCGLCSFPSLLKLGKQIRKTTDEIVALKRKVDEIETMAKKPALKYKEKYAEKIDKFPSLNQHVSKLKEFLENEELKRICIWGPAGVGKTKIMENLHDEVGRTSDLDLVLWVTVGDKNVRGIQEVLLKRLNLKSEDNNDERGEMISEELEKRRYVLFLDDVLSEINLREIGISDSHTHGKVIFACRYKKICGHTDEEIRVKRLSNKDAENLFWDTVGGNLKDNRDIRKVAEDIINECGGMPSLLKVMGRYLAKEEDPAIWRDTLLQITSPSYEPKQKLEPFYKILKVQCDKLDSGDRACFLYIACFPARELPQDYVIDCWRAEQYLRNLTTLGNARDRGRALLNELVQKSLLESGEKVAHYKMFVHFRRVACRLAQQYENRTIYTQEGKNNREIEWGDAKWISLFGMCRSTPMEKPNSDEILTFLVQESSREVFPESFCESTLNLHVLDLRATRLRLLPISINHLKSLRALFLNKCPQLVQLPAELGDLSSLEILDIRDTGIHGLPIEIKKLSCLKCLRVSFTENVGYTNHVETGPREMISPDTIAGLCFLEELSIYVEPNSCRWVQNVTNVALEVAALENLTTLLFYFPEVECLQTFVNTSKSWNGNKKEKGNSFRSFSIHVGNHHRSCPCAIFDVSGCSDEKHLRFCSGEEFPDAVLKILEQANAFELIDHHNAANLSSFGVDNLQGLKACTIENCREMTSIIDGNHARGAFKWLNKLYIKNLPRLVRIWEGSIESESLKNLTTLTLKGCGSLQSLFSQEIVVQLEGLHYLQVEDCPLLEEIIKGGSCSGDFRAFPKLKELELIRLPRLSDICSNLSLKWDSLEKIMIDACEKLRNFSSIFEAAAKLTEIRCSEYLLNQCVWPDDSVRDRFKGLRRLTSGNSITHI